MSHCVLVAKWIGDGPMESLLQRIYILGTTQENDYFTININPGM